MSPASMREPRTHLLDIALGHVLVQAKDIVVAAFWHGRPMLHRSTAAIIGVSWDPAKPTNVEENPFMTTLIRLPFNSGATKVARVTLSACK